MVVVIDCYGTPYEIGLAHGKAATQNIKNNINTYTKFNREWLDKSWDELKPLAELFKKTLEEKAPFLLEEIQGIADGSKRDVLDILILNARYEIGLAGAAFDKTNVTDSVDGCTSFSENFHGNQWIGQNWDWQTEILDNLVFLNIYPSDKSVPKCKVIAEAGLLGQTGLNEHGLGIVVNALYAQDLDTSKIPCTLIRRIILRYDTKEKAIAEMERLGVSAVSHILVGDKTSAVSIETSPLDSMSYLPPKNEILAHTNHCLMPPKGVKYSNVLQDSFPRYDIMNDYLVKNYSIAPSYDKYLSILENEENLPSAINRYPDSSKEGSKATVRTCYSLIMDLSKRIGRVSFGNPKQPQSVIEFAFSHI